MMTIKTINNELIKSLSTYLNEMPDFIQSADIQTLIDCGATQEMAFSVLLASALGLNLDKDFDKDLFDRYFPHMIHHLLPEDYHQNAYYKQIKFNTLDSGKCRLTYESYKPFEAFVCDDFMVFDDGRVIPQIGYFDQTFNYPALLEDNREWMTTIPNEINTMKKPIAEAHGKVLTFGLGLGYFAFMASIKDNVESVTVVEQNDDVICLFRQFILPQFTHPEKIIIRHDDAFRFAAAEMPQGNFDFIFTDLWHDVSDGLPMYERMKTFESSCPHAQFEYWIEKTMRCYYSNC